MGEDGGLIAGHARILAARQLGIAEIPVMRRPAPLLDARRDRRDLRIRVGPGIFGIRDQPIDRPSARPYPPATAFDFRPPVAQARARATEGKCWRFNLVSPRDLLPGARQPARDPIAPAI